MPQMPAVAINREHSNRAQLTGATSSQVKIHRRCTPSLMQQTAASILQLEGWGGCTSYFHPVHLGRVYCELAAAGLLANSCAMHDYYNRDYNSSSNARAQQGTQVPQKYIRSVYWVYPVDGFACVEELYTSSVSNPAHFPSSHCQVYPGPNNRSHPV